MICEYVPPWSDCSLCSKRLLPHLGRIHINFYLNDGPRTWHLASKYKKEQITIILTFKVKWILPSQSQNLEIKPAIIRACYIVSVIVFVIRLRKVYFSGCFPPVIESQYVEFRCEILNKKKIKIKTHFEFLLFWSKVFVDNNIWSRPG